MTVQNAVVERALRHALKRQGYALSRNRRRGETGVDIQARRSRRTVHIEVIGYKRSGPARSKDFYEVWFRALSRVGSGAACCAIALPIEFGRGLQRRADHYGAAWRRLAAAFPEIKLWLVHHHGPSSPSFEVRSWQEWCR